MLVQQAVQYPDQREQRVRREAAEAAAVHGVIHRADLDVDLRETTQGQPERRDAGPDVAGVGDDRGVGAEVVRWYRVEGGGQPGTVLLLALHQHGYSDRRPSSPGPDRTQVHREVALVVGGAAPEQGTVADDRVERRRGPGDRVARRLDVVVGVEQHRGRARRRRDPAGDGRWLARDRQQLDVRHAGVRQEIGGQVGGPAQRFGRMAGKRHRRDRDQPRQVGDEAGQERGGFHHVAVFTTRGGVHTSDGCFVLIVIGNPVVTEEG
nr:hypothetical protein [Cryptosporangium aurantiacum]